MSALGCCSLGTLSSQQTSRPGLEEKAPMRSTDRRSARGAIIDFNVEASLTDSTPKFGASLLGPEDNPSTQHRRVVALPTSSPTERPTPAHSTGQWWFHRAL
ncbi:hypothetical protein DPEC_G00305310 [Dallia pectoralis]|uniref:Uncharacterized protein n=1 Tax=Dallia pectoralis TaxID=75939 RepID=A0ACC2FDS2_DALPE|nr:hypothetical protein DPEC_G00305310 [Dallia pectoralis]